jgi:hypothetical protein
MAKPLLTLMTSSWFQKEVISRASGFMVLPHMWTDQPLSMALETAKIEELPVISVAHSFRPHRWKRLYPNEDWINVLEGHDAEIEVTFDAVDQQGRVHHSWSGAAVYFHERLDMVALKARSPQFPKELARLSEVFDLSGIVQTEFSSDETLAAPVDIYGNQVTACGLPEESFQAVKIPGAVTHHSSHQLFIRTTDKLETGVCGGPVRDSEGRLVGMVEGVINPPTPVALASPDRDIQAVVAGQGAAIRRTIIEGFLPLALRWTRASI